MMHPLTISGNEHVGVQHRFIMADSLKRISGRPGMQPPEAVRFLKLKGIKISKIDAKNIKINNASLYRTSPLDYRDFQQETMAHPGLH